jgi:ABC-type uncharacterized transport system permease subunit
MSRLEPRLVPSRAMMLSAPLIAAAAMLVSGSLLFLFLGQAPLHAFYVYFIQPLTSWYGIGELLLKATPLILCGVGLAIGFRANVHNIGADGQLTMGAVAAGAVALHVDAAGEGAGAWLLPLMLLAGALGGMAWAAVPALLRIRFNTSEILVSLMLVYVAYLYLGYLVHGPLRDPAGFNFPQSKMFGDAALLPLLKDGLRVNAAFLLSLLAAAGACPAWRRRRRCTPASRHRTTSGSPSSPAARWRAWPAWARWRGRSASCRPRCRPATGSRRSSWPTSDACIRSGWCWRRS